MARKKNYSSDQLKRIVDSYVKYKSDYAAITATALAEYSNSILHLAPAVTYQTFTRDSVVSQYIAKINASLHERMLVPSSKGANAFVDSCYLEDTADADEIRKKAIDMISKREELILELQSEYKKCCKRLTSVMQEKEALTDRNKTLMDAVAEQKKEIALLKKQNKEDRKMLNTFKKCIKTHLYEPIVIRRVSQLGWISDKSDAIKRCSVNADIIAEIDKLQRDAEAVADEPITVSAKTKAVSPGLPEGDATVVNSASAAFLSQLRNM